MILILRYRTEDFHSVLCDAKTFGSINYFEPRRTERIMEINLILITNIIIFLKQY